MGPAAIWHGARGWVSWIGYGWHVGRGGRGLGGGRGGARPSLDEASYGPAVDDAGGAWDNNFETSAPAEDSGNFWELSV